MGSATAARWRARDEGWDDIEPAHALGVRRVWINRRGEEGDQRFGPYDELPDLSRLPPVLGL